MKMFLTAFGLHNPFAGPRLQSHSVIPIATDAKGGLDLDYSALLIAESFIIDRTAYDYVNEWRNRFLKPMHHSLKVLESEGFLEIVDYSEPLKKYSPQIVAKTSQLVENIEPWLSIGRKQWNLVKSEFEEFGRLYSLASDKEFDSAHYGVVSFLERRDGRIDYNEVARIHSLLESSRRRLKIAEEQEVREVLKPLVAQVLMNDLLRRWLKAPFLDWDDAQEFHDQLHVAQWTELDEINASMNEIAVESHALFHTIVPELLPNRIEDVVKFLRNRTAVRSLRDELWACLRDGDSVSPEWMLRLHREAGLAKLRTEERNRVIKWIGRVAGLMLPGGGIIGDVLMAAAEDGIEFLSDESMNSRFEWYYVLQRIKMK